MARVKFEISAGGGVFRRRDSEVEVAMIGLKGGEVWALPKGLVEKGESLEVAALREVKEETGLAARIVDRIDKIDYWFYWKEGDSKVKHHKIVYFYLMEYIGGSIADHDYEAEEVRWFRIDEAIEVASYKSEKKVLKKAKEMIESYARG